MAFVVVLTSLLLQGSTIAWSARRLGVARPDPKDERGNRLVFGDFVVDTTVPMDLLCGFHGLPAPAESQTEVAAWLRAEIKRPPVLGDGALLGAAELSACARWTATASSGWATG